MALVDACEITLAVSPRMLYRYVLLVSATEVLTLSARGDLPKNRCVALAGLCEYSDGLGCGRCGVGSWFKGGNDDRDETKRLAPDLRIPEQ